MYNIEISVRLFLLFVFRSWLVMWETSALFRLNIPITLNPRDECQIFCEKGDKFMKNMLLYNYIENHLCHKQCTLGIQGWTQSFCHPCFISKGTKVNCLDKMMPIDLLMGGKKIALSHWDTWTKAYLMVTNHALTL